MDGRSARCSRARASLSGLRRIGLAHAGGILGSRPTSEPFRAPLTAFTATRADHARGPSRRLTSLAAVLPARNEEGNIEAAVLETWHEVERLAERAEIIVVDDGSSDRTAALVEALEGQVPSLRLVRHAHARGYGAAVRSGFAAANSEWLFFTDADRQFDVGELEQLVALSDDNDVVAGIRARRRDPAHRRLMARMWNRLIALTLGVRLRDLNCAFKLLRAEVVRSLDLSTDGSAFGAELALALEHRGARIAQLPVSHRPRTWGRQTGGDPAVILRALADYWRLLARFRGGRLAPSRAALEGGQPRASGDEAR